MEPIVEPNDGVRPRSMAADVWSYVALAFGLAWAAWIIAIKLHAREELLTIGSVGPAVAAMILSWRRQPAVPRRALLRVSTFLLVGILGWVVISLYYAWRGRAHLSFHLVPWLLVCALLPAWILSAAFSKDSGVRALLRRLVHPPNRWSLLALLLLPTILLFPAMVAHLLHAPLVMPVRHGSISATVAVAAMAFLYNILFVAVLEEPGWRGFLLDRLQQRFSPLFASLIVWLLWAVWHAPLDFSRPGPFSLGMYLQVRVIFLLPIVMILTWLYNRSERSIQATAIFHASMNTFPFVLPYFRPGLALLFVVAAYGVVADRMWRKADTRVGSG